MLPRDLLDIAVTFCKTPHPVSAAGRDHRATTRRDERAEHGVAVGDPVDRRRVAGVEQPGGDELVLCGLVRSRRARGRRPTEVGRRCCSEDLEVARGAVDAGRVRQAVTVGEVAAVALVADDRRRRAEQVAVVEAGAVEDPVLGPVQRVATGALRRPFADAVVAAAAEADAGHVVLGTVEQMVGPDRGQLRLPVGPEHRVLLEEALVADHRRRRAVTAWTGRILQPHLPEGGVAGEEHGVPAPGGERLDRVAHRRRPVLVVADRQVQRVRRVGSEQVGVLLEVGVGDDVDLVALPLGPLDERPAPVGPAGRPAVRRQVVHPQVTDVAGGLRIRRVDRRDPLAGAGGLVQVARCHRAQHRRLRRAGVEVATPEVVVGMPGVGVDRPQDLRNGRRERRPDDEERPARAPSALDVDGEQHFVVAGAPARLDGDLGGERPAASLLRRIGGRRMVAGGDTVLDEDDLPGRSGPRHLHRHRTGARR